MALSCVHFSSIILVDSTLVHFVPSNTENLAIFVGVIRLLIDKINELSLLITVNS